MKQLIVAAIALLGILGLGTTNPATAQALRPFAPGYGGNPAISPYLNLLQRGNPAVNYYGLVRPQQQYIHARRSDSLLRAAFACLPRPPARSSSSATPCARTSGEWCSARWNAAW